VSTPQLEPEISLVLQQRGRGPPTPIAGRGQSVTCGNIVPIQTLILHLSRPIQGTATAASPLTAPGTAEDVSCCNTLIM